MARKSSASIADKWARNLGSATTDMQAGANAVTVNPAEKAAARQDAWLAGVQRAAANNKFRQGLGRTTLDSWRKAYIEKGLPRIQAGTAQAKSKVAAFHDQLGPFQESLLAQINQSNPRGDKATNINRAVAFMQGMTNFKKT